LKRLRKNQEIKALAIRLVGDEGEQLGVLPLEKALEKAVSEGLDLVEVSPKARPPVCKVMDYGKYLYKLKKQEQKQQSGAKQTEVKGVRLGMNTGVHDLETKAKQARKFLGDKNLIKVSLIFRGREMSHKELGYDKMDEFVKMLHDVAELEARPRMSGYQLTAVLVPRRKALVTDDEMEDGIGN
jgi:translation initiation factor IF-3